MVMTSSAALTGASRSADELPVGGSGDVLISKCSEHRRGHGQQLLDKNRQEVMVMKQPMDSSGISVVDLDGIRFFGFRTC